MRILIGEVHTNRTNLVGLVSLNIKLNNYSSPSLERFPVWLRFLAFFLQFFLIPEWFDLYDARPDLKMPPIRLVSIFKRSPMPHTSRCDVLVIGMISSSPLLLPVFVCDPISGFYLPNIELIASSWVLSLWRVNDSWGCKALSLCILFEKLFEEPVDGYFNSNFCFKKITSFKNFKN